MGAIEEYFGPNGPGATDQKFDAASFLGFLRRSNPVWHAGDSKRDLQSWVYRGHQDLGWKLIPSAARRPNKLDAVIDRLSVVSRDFPDWDKSNLKVRHQFLHIAAYLVAMRKFILLGNDLGFIDQPAPDEDYLEQPDKLRNYFVQIASHHSVGKSAIDALSPFVNFKATYAIGTGGGWQPNYEFVTALAQHHGVPTFLLDWTENPWVAAFFTTTATADNKDKRDVCVWALNLSVLELPTQSAAASSGLGVVHSYKPPKSGNAYLAAQSGLLTYIESSVKNNGQNIFLDGEELYPSLQDVVGKYDCQQQSLKDRHTRSNEETARQKVEVATTVAHGKCLLRKVILAKEHLPDLRRLLSLEGVTKAHLMPTLDNVAITSFDLLLDSLNRS